MGLRHSDDAWLQTSSFVLFRSTINEPLRGLTGPNWLVTVLIPIAFFIASLPDFNKRVV